MKLKMYCLLTSLSKSQIQYKQQIQTFSQFCESNLIYRIRFLRNIYRFIVQCLNYCKSDLPETYLEKVIGDKGPAKTLLLLNKQKLTGDIAETQIAVVDG